MPQLFIFPEIPSKNIGMEENVPWERKSYSRKASVLTEEVVDFVRKCLDEDTRCKSRKQHHTARRIFERLVAECGFTGVRRLSDGW